ncbi:hypothetical protein WR25_16124 isoform A [Diploscapter pachys]|uniref:Uncharacterized protein n=1 Tax=Diploscapter pachys TaxID=2018661 RepID=A0A2A2LB35_9BILA|nr:hypothetical protein WR25_16124 isoform A [Diploscapter pachys]
MQRRSNDPRDSDGLKDTILKAIYNNVSEASEALSYRNPSENTTTPSSSNYDVHRAQSSRSDGNVYGHHSPFSFNAQHSLKSENFKTPLVLDVLSPGCSAPLSPCVLSEANLSNRRTNDSLLSGKENRFSFSAFDRTIFESYGIKWFRACRTGDLFTAKSLLDAHPELISFGIGIHHEHTCVHLACSGSYLELMSFLRSRGADFNARTSAGYTVLHLAAIRNDKRMVRMLVEKYGVDPTITDMLGYTYEHYALWIIEQVYKCDDNRFSPRCTTPSTGSTDTGSNKVSNLFRIPSTIADPLRQIVSYAESKLTK